MNNFQFSIFNFQSRSRGYTLLFAVLVAALVLGVAVFILEISTKQYELSASARDSMYSFYAADSGIECVALDQLYATSSSAINFTCGNDAVTWTVIPISDPNGIYKDDGYYYELDLNLQFSSPTCAVIDIVAFYSPQPNSYEHDITTSRGYNHCVNIGTSGAPNWVPDTSNPNTVERALQLSHTTAPPGSY